MSRMECSITDGLQYDDWLEGGPEEEDPDTAYDLARQEAVDNGDQWPPCCEPQELQDIENETRRAGE